MDKEVIRNNIASNKKLSKYLKGRSGPYVCESLSKGCICLPKWMNFQQKSEGGGGNFLSKKSKAVESFSENSSILAGRGLPQHFISLFAPQSSYS